MLIGFIRIDKFLVDNFYLHNSVFKYFFNSAVEITYIFNEYINRINVNTILSTNK